MSAPALAVATAAPGLSPLSDPDLVTPCRQSGADPELWFATAPAAESAAVEACRGCLVREACLRAAMEHEVGAGPRNRFGVWGGMTALARQRLARAQAEERARAERQRRGRR